MATTATIDNKTDTACLSMGPLGSNRSIHGLTLPEASKAPSRMRQGQARLLHRRGASLWRGVEARIDRKRQEVALPLTGQPKTSIAA
jgi:hypothetical protein